MTYSTPTMYHKPTRMRACKDWLQSHQAMLSFVCMAAWFVASVLYMMQIHVSIEQGYTIRSLESEIAELQEENQRLKVVVHKAQSLERVERAVPILGLVPADAPKYVSAGEQFVLAD